MNLVKIIGAGAFVVSAGVPAIAAHPPLGRPTPPPCCADGVCYPNVGEWGWYRTNWRRWPTEELQPTPTTGAPKPGAEIPDLERYETPTPEQEDQRAPPRTKTREEPEEGAPTPRATPLPRPRGAGPEAPRTPYAPGPTTPTTPPSLLNPPTSPLTPGPRTPMTPGPATPERPSPQSPPSLLTPPPTRMPWENGGQPTGDWDPPPAPPTATAATGARRSDDLPPVLPSPTRRVPGQPNRPAVPPREQMPNGDPPPGLPVALASASY
jgi:hypothetical protein